MGASDEDAEFDDLGSWAHLKRMLTRRWTSQLRGTNRFKVNESATSLEDADDATELIDNVIGKATEIVALPVTEHAENLPGGKLKIQQRMASSRPSSAERPVSQGSSRGRNSAVMIEEERPNWLQELGRGMHFSSKETVSESRRPSHAAASDGRRSHDGGQA